MFVLHHLCEVYIIAWPITYINVQKIDTTVYALPSMQMLVFGDLVIHWPNTAGLLCGV